MGMHVPPPPVKQRPQCETNHHGGVPILGVIALIVFAVFGTSVVASSVAFRRGQCHGMWQIENQAVKRGHGTLVPDGPNRIFIWNYDPVFEVPVPDFPNFGPKE